jgi:hypothetical protein
MTESLSRGELKWKNPKTLFSPSAASKIRIPKSGLSLIPLFREKDVERSP